MEGVCHQEWEEEWEQVAGEMNEQSVFLAGINGVEVGGGHRLGCLWGPRVSGRTE